MGEESIRKYKTGGGEEGSFCYRVFLVVDGFIQDNFFCRQQQRRDQAHKMINSTCTINMYEVLVVRSAPAAASTTTRSGGTLAEKWAAHATVSIPRSKWPVKKQASVRLLAVLLQKTQIGVSLVQPSCVALTLSLSLVSFEFRHLSFTLHKKYHFKLPTDATIVGGGDVALL